MKIIGVIMLALPFVGVFVSIVRWDGLKEAVIIFGELALLFLWIGCAIFLLVAR